MLNDIEDNFEITEVYLMIDIKKIVGNNIKTFIESRERKHSWVIERTGIKKNAYYDMLNGKDIIDEHITKLNRLFRIKDPMYFYKTDFDYAKPKNLLNRKENFLNHVTLSYQGEITPELIEGFEVFFDFVELIDVLKATTE